MKLTILFLALFVISCSTNSIERSSVINYESKKSNCIEKIKSINDHFKSSKGKADLKLKTDQRTNSFKIAWAQLKPDKIRLEILDTSGHLIATISSNGNYHYVLDYLKKMSHVIPSENYNLKKLLTIPIKTKDIIYLLSGGIYLEDHEYKTSKLILTETGMTLETYSFLGNLKKKILFDNAYNIHRIDYFQGTANRIYSVELTKLKNFETYSAPSRITISNEKSLIQLKIRKLVEDSQITMDIFTLTSPKGW